MLEKRFVECVDAAKRDIGHRGYHPAAGIQFYGGLSPAREIGMRRLLRGEPGASIIIPIKQVRSVWDPARDDVQDTGLSVDATDEEHMRALDRLFSSKTTQPVELDMDIALENTTFLDLAAHNPTKGETILLGYGDFLAAMSSKGLVDLDKPRIHLLHDPVSGYTSTSYYDLGGISAIDTDGRMRALDEVAPNLIKKIADVDLMATGVSLGLRREWQDVREVFIDGLLPICSFGLPGDNEMYLRIFADVLELPNFGFDAGDKKRTSQESLRLHEIYKERGRKMGRLHRRLLVPYLNATVAVLEGDTDIRRVIGQYYDDVDTIDLTGPEQLFDPEEDPLWKKCKALIGL